LVMVIIGGAGTLSGPVLGAFLVRLLPHLVSSYTDRWQTIVGLVFILFVLFAPQGIMGLLRGQRRRRKLV
jgi:branched-chain amino acid transport system permease protein